METRRRAGLAREVRRTGSRDQNNFVLRPSDFDDGKTYGGVRQVAYYIDMLYIEPLPGNSRTEVRLVLMTAEMISIRLPLIDQPNSSAAIRAASTEPLPDALDKGPFISAIIPILTTSSEVHPGLADAARAAINSTG
jgi:hypothetical protein